MDKDQLKRVLTERMAIGPGQPWFESKVHPIDWLTSHSANFSSHNKPLLYWCARWMYMRIPAAFVRLGLQPNGIDEGAG